jgi:hypothetical protein
MRCRGSVRWLAAWPDSHVNLVSMYLELYIQMGMTAMVYAATYPKGPLVKDSGKIGRRATDPA